MRIEVYEGEQMVGCAEWSGSLELGRRSTRAAASVSETRAGRGAAMNPLLPNVVDPPPPPQRTVYVWNRDATHSRLVIARQEENTISRRHAILESVSADRVLLKNLSASQGLSLPEEGKKLLPGESREIRLPALLVIGAKSIRIKPAEEEECANLQSLAGESIAPGQTTELLPLSQMLARQTEPGLEIEGLVRWLQTVMGVLQSAATSTGFFTKAAQALVDRVGLETGWVLLWKNDDWHVEAVSTTPDSNPAHQPSRQLLNQIRASRRACWMDLLPDPKRQGSLLDVQSVVAAPILDHTGEVIGALYGDCGHGNQIANGQPSNRLEALLVELLASGVANGLARLTQEQAALSARVQLEQFFTPELSQELADHPDLLQGKDQEVTVLFCDLRGFSRLSERLGPAGTVDWLHDLLSELSDCVRRRQGVLVDYVGDELFAMFGTPKQTADHAWDACQSALEMVARLPQINQRWLKVTGEPVSIGIGVNTGVARVGNVGSRYKFKYGPLGSVVNLARRVQGVTRYLDRPLLVTAETWQRVRERCAWRRLGKVRLVNITDPVELYELLDPEPPHWPNLNRAYQEALSAFEQNKPLLASQCLGRLLAQYPEDGPVRVLLMRAMLALNRPSDPFDPVWELPGK